jgi:capsular exopolysaccharide synthesis family protein
VAQLGQRVILVDADLRRPSVKRVFGMGPGLGLTDYLRDPSLGLSVARETQIENLRVVTSGPTPPNPSELLSSHRMQEFIEMASADADVVIIDSPPALVVTDPSILCSRVDGILLVLDMMNTPMRAAAQTIQALQMVGGHVIGVVANRFDPRNAGYYRGSHYYYHYQSGYYGATGEDSRPSGDDRPQTGETRSREALTR